MTQPVRITHAIAAILATAFVAALMAAAASGAGGTGGAGYDDPAAIVGTPALYARPGAMLGGTFNFRGTTTPNRAVSIERLDPALGTWTTATTATADAAGGFVAHWESDHIGVFTFRVVGGSETRGARIAGDPPSIQVTVYKPARATWYGPGLYGKKTACGQRLTRALVGVAHRGLPSGGSVASMYKGRTLVVPVVDRGPFREGANWDLTAAAAKQLGFARSDRIGAVALPPAATATKK